jgi:PKD repeat protein/N-acetylneuraminic acid mutarotase
MRLPKLLIWLAMLALLLGVVSIAVAAAPPPTKPIPQPSTGVSLNAPAGQIESISGSYAAFDPSVGGDTCYIPGVQQTFCFKSESFTNDWGYVYYQWQRFPSDWTVNNAYVLSSPAPVCTGGGTWGTFSWTGTAANEGYVYHPRYQTTTDDCTAYYCFEVTSGTGTPDALESWWWAGDDYGNPPYHPCSNDNYTPPGQTACDEAVQPQAAIPPCTLPPVMLTPGEIDVQGCPCEEQQHEFTAWNNAGYDTTINLSYNIVQGNGDCGGPASVYVTDGTNLTFTVNLNPLGDPGDVVICEIYAEDAADPANNDASYIVKTLIAGGFDSAGWQLENISGALPVQWGMGVVGTNPAAAGPVGYYAGGLASTTALLPNLQMYDPGTDTWTQLATLPNPRFSSAAGWIGGLLYLAGGHDANFVATNDLQVYDPATNTWDNTTYPDMPNARGGGAGGVGTCSSGSGECLFHVGGGPDSSFANTTLETWQYDPSAMAWTQLDNKPAGSSPDGFILGGGVGCMGYVFAGGDYRGFHEFYRLDATQPSGSQWTQLANIPAGGGAMTPAMVCKEDMGAILLIGGDSLGYWSDLYNNKVYVYDIATDTWNGPLPQTLNAGLLGSMGLHMDNKVWTFGGTNGSGPTTPVPHESLAQVFCEPCGGLSAHKDAPATALTGDVISYTITIEADPLIPGTYMADPLPAGVDYADNLTYTMGYAWYSPTANTVFWEYNNEVKSGGAFAPAARTFGEPVANPGLTTASPAVTPGAVAAPANPEDVLWDQPLSAVDQDAYVDQEFGDFPTFSSFLADDFVNADPWAISTIFIPGDGWNGFTTIMSATALTWQIYADSPITPGIPAGDPSGGGDAPVWTLTLTPDDPLVTVTTGTLGYPSNTTLNLAAPVVLPPGHWWLVFYPTGDFATFGQFGRQAADTTNGYTGQIINPGGGFGIGTAWQDWGVIGVTLQDIAFRLEGQPAPTEAVISFDVTVTGNCGDIITNEGMATDGDNVVDFSASTEVVCAGEPDISVDPLSLYVPTCPDDTELLTFTICNTGTAPLDWMLSEAPATARLVGLQSPLASPIGPSREVELKLEATGGPSVETNPPVVDAAVSLVLDDGSADNYIGLNDGTFGYQFLWLNRFTPDAADFPFDLNQISVVLGSTGVAVGDPIDLVVYQDTDGDGDPSNAAWLATYNVTVQYNDGATWNDYLLVTPLTLTGPGDVLIGVINRYQVSGVDPSDFPAALDQTATQQRSWVAAWSGDPPDPAVLPPDAGGLWDLIDTWFPGNWMIRGYGETYTFDVPWLSEDPTSGTVNPGLCQVVDVTFDATGLTPGDYNANLLIASNDPDTPVITMPVTMEVWEPVALVDVTYTIASLEVTFDATATGEEPISYAWNFGDGNTSSDEDPVHVYDEGGCYTVTLTVQNPCGIEEWSELICVVTPCEPIEGAGFDWAPVEPLVDETVYFSATVPLTGTGPFTYTWDFDDGSGDTGMYVNHAFAAADTYSVTLTVENACSEVPVVVPIKVEIAMKYFYLPIVVKNH